MHLTLGAQRKNEIALEMVSRSLTPRNALCPCGQGGKYKHCHGNLLTGVPQQELVARQNAQKLQQFQRCRQQGLGRPIESKLQPDGKRAVMVGTRRHVGRFPTFQSFLLAYLHNELGIEWGQSELLKPVEQQHPVVQWNRLFVNMHKSDGEGANGIRRGKATGASQALIGLAYDLYLMEHNGAQISDPTLRTRLIERLKNSNEFLGVAYEIRVAAIFLRAGFHLRWENDREGGRQFGEFVATFPATGEMFTVECKIRQQESGKEQSGFGKFVGLLVKALKKDLPHRRFVFVDQSYPIDSASMDANQWGERVAKYVRGVELDPKQAGLPSAYVVVTNFPYRYQLEQRSPQAFFKVFGFKMGDYPLDPLLPLREALDIREGHLAMEAVGASMVEHFEIPATFDGAIPGLSEQDQWMIGQRYRMEDGVEGVMEDACVLPNTTTIYLTLVSDDGHRMIYRGTLSDAAKQAYERYPETFFGQMRQSPHPCNTVLQLFDDLLPAHLAMSRDSLLNSVKDHPDQVLWQTLSHEELARQVVIALVTATLAQRQASAPQESEMASSSS
jgi:hypothetical protein